MNKKMIGFATAAALTAGLVTASSSTDHDRSTRATLTTADGTSIGSVDFRSDDGHTEVRVRLTGAPGLDAFHGFHIHANDVVANGVGCIADASAAPATWFVSADGHYNPTAQTHSHHVGDMPVVYVNADGTVETRFRIDKIVPGDVVGKVVILHAGADNFGNIPLGTGSTQYAANSGAATTATARTGNAGDRIACGVIETR